MQVTVFGASGKVGQLVVERLLAGGHSVAGFVYQSSPFADTKGLRVITGDVHDASQVRAAIQGSQAVICALGSWGTKTKDIVSAGTRAIIPAMDELGVKRFVSVTGSGAVAPADQPTLFEKLGHAGFGIMAHKILVDSEVHLGLLAKSGLDWTVIRSPVMTSSPGDEYRLTKQSPSPWETIHRQAVARALVEQLADTRFIHQAPHIHTAKSR